MGYDIFETDLPSLRINTECSDLVRTYLLWIVSNADIQKASHERLRIGLHRHPVIVVINMLTNKLAQSVKLTSNLFVRGKVEKELEECSNKADQKASNEAAYSGTGNSGTGNSGTGNSGTINTS
nr:uncharacterized protein CTRU02_08880 [Colletotrichum truncatum]KAF6789633.1 hypothetical protein CTRU02_08880 [Colletotrichum truncatum]